MLQKGHDIRIQTDDGQWRQNFDIDYFTLADKIVSASSHYYLSVCDLSKIPHSLCRVWSTFNSDGTMNKITYTVERNESRIEHVNTSMRWLVAKRNDVSFFTKNILEVTHAARTGHRLKVVATIDSFTYVFSLPFLVDDKGAILNQINHKLRQITFPYSLNKDLLKPASSDSVNWYIVVRRTSSKDRYAFIPRPAIFLETENPQMVLMYKEGNSLRRYAMPANTVDIMQDGDITLQYFKPSMLGVWRKYHDYTKWSTFIASKDILHEVQYLGLGGWNDWSQSSISAVVSIKPDCNTYWVKIYEVHTSGVFGTHSELIEAITEGRSARISYSFNDRKYYFNLSETSIKNGTIYAGTTFIKAKSKNDPTSIFEHNIITHVLVNSKKAKVTLSKFHMSLNKFVKADVISTNVTWFVSV